MCGISVIIDPANKHIHDSEIRSMNNLVRHRGPDGEGYYAGDHFALGHRMLKITDFSAQGRQPMAYLHYIIIFNGEIYNFRTLRDSLKKDGYSFHTMSDTEVVMAAYDKWGEACLDHFAGMWSFVLYNSYKKELFCSRDRYGIKPLFYARAGRKLLLGSEIKQLNAFPDFKPVINRAAAFDFLYHAKIARAEESFFEGVQFLPGGHNLTYDLQSHSFKVTKWYDIQKVKVAQPGSFREAVDTFGHLFTESVLLHGVSKLPVGACLSGGLDSTSITGISKKTNNPLITFSSCYTQNGYNEIEYINEAVSHYGFPNHKTYPNIHELVDHDLLKKIIYHQDQPILSGSFFSEFKVFENAAQNNLRIILSGQGADEFLGGYSEFSLLNLKGLLKKKKLTGFARTIANQATKQNKTIRETLMSFVMFGMSIPYFDKKTERRSKYNVTSCIHPKWIYEFRDQSNTFFDISAYSSLSDLSKDALTGYSLPHQLLSEDRNSMLHSIESRLPFLDHRLVEYCLSLPDNYIIRNGATKAILRESMKDVLPPAIYNRHAKLGFPGPEESLFTHHYDSINKELRDLVQQLPGIFSPGLINLHTAFYKNQVPYDNILFRALAFCTWAREFGLIEPQLKSGKKAVALKQDN